jgi:hypothetical protein
LKHAHPDRLSASDGVLELEDFSLCIRVWSGEVITVVFGLKMKYELHAKQTVYYFYHIWPSTLHRCGSYIAGRLPHPPVLLCPSTVSLSFSYCPKTHKYLPIRDLLSLRRWDWEIHMKKKEKKKEKKDINNAGPIVTRKAKPML